MNVGVRYAEEGWQRGGGRGEGAGGGERGRGEGAGSIYSPENQLKRIKSGQSIPENKRQTDREKEREKEREEIS